MINAVRTLTPNADGLPISGPKGKPNRIVVAVAAWFELLVGVSFLLAINVQSKSLFGAVPVGIGIAFGRFSGIALIAVGLACLPSGSAAPERNTVRGLFVLNLGAAAFLGWIAIATTFRGFILWPVIVVHALLATALLAQLPNKDLMPS